MLEIADDRVHRLGDKKVVQIEVAKEENTVIYLGGGPCMYVCNSLGPSEPVICARTNKLIS